jgi:hypothetical protein
MRPPKIRTTTISAMACVSLAVAVLIAWPPVSPASAVRAVLSATAPLFTRLDVPAPISPGDNAWVSGPYDRRDYMMAFTRAHWWPEGGCVILFAGGSHNYKAGNAVRCFRPSVGTVEILWPADWQNGGLQNRDNHISVLVPSRNEFWVWGGTYTSSDPPGPVGKHYGGRFNLVSQTWQVFADQSRIGDAIPRFGAGLIRDFRYIPNSLPATGWSESLDTGVVFGGDVEGNPANDLWLIEPNPGGPEPYRLLHVQTGPKVSNVQQRGVAMGRYFYVVLGMQAWRLDIPARAWVRLADPPVLVGAYASVTGDPERGHLVVHGGYDWQAKRVTRTTLVYDVATNVWSDVTGTMRGIGIQPVPRFNHVAAFGAGRHWITAGDTNETCPWDKCGLGIIGYTTPASARPPVPRSTAPEVERAAEPAARSSWTTIAAAESDSCSGATAVDAAGRCPWPVTAQVQSQSAVATRVEIAARTWVSRPLPGWGKSPCPTGGRHQRLALNPENGRIYTVGGDWDGPGSGYTSGRNEVFSYSIADGDWRQEYPYYGPPGEVQPSHPDEVGWVWVPKWRKFFLLSGFFFGLQSGGEPDQSQRATYVTGTLTFDPLTRKWEKIAESSPSTGEHGKWAVYDPKRDQIYQFRWDGGSGSVLDRLDLSVTPPRWLPAVSLAWSGGRHGAGEYLNEARLDKEYVATDFEGRWMYVIDWYKQRFLRFSMDRLGIGENLGGLPASATVDATIPVWDAKNKVVIWPRQTNLDGNVSIYVYKPSEYHAVPGWEAQPDPPMSVEGARVRGNSAIYHPEQNAVLLMCMQTGGDVDPSLPRELYLYRHQ